MSTYEVAQFGRNFVGQLTKDQFVILLLVSSFVLVPVPIAVERYWLKRVDNTQLQFVLRVWTFTLCVVLLARGAIGLLLASGAHLWAVSAFYPFRVASPNYAIFAGAPYAIAVAAFGLWIDRIARTVIASRHKAFFLWVLALALSIAFGAIHGGPIAGNIGVANEPDHLHDASINASVGATFATHNSRVAGDLIPQYRAPHSFSHPAGSVVYWQVVARRMPPVVFSLLNAFALSLTFLVVLWVLEKQFKPETAVATTLAVLATPGILIYGRSDDALYYFLSVAAVGIAAIAIATRRYWQSSAAGLLAALAVNVSYAGMTLIPVMFSFVTDTHLSRIELAGFVRKAIGHFLIVMAIVLAALLVEARLVGFDYLKGFIASAAHSHAYTFVAILGQGQFIRAFNDRVMTLADFVLMGGPLLLYTLILAGKEFVQPVNTWYLRTLSLFMLLGAILFGMASAGETGRDWGSLYPLIGIFFLPKHMEGFETSARYHVIRLQLFWALALQIPVNFGW